MLSFLQTKMKLGIWKFFHGHQYVAVKSQRTNMQSLQIPTTLAHVLMLLLQDVEKVMKYRGDYKD